MKALNLQNRTFGIIENGTWACTAGKNMIEMINTMKNMTVLDEKVTIISSMSKENESQIDDLVSKIKQTI